MKLVTEQSELEALPPDRWERARRVDLILDDGSLLQDVCAIGEQAFGMVPGGQTGTVEFADVDALKDRSIRTAFEIQGLFAAPLIGRWLRSRRAAGAGADFGRPDWLPPL